MLESNEKITNKIIRYAPDTEAMAINVEIATGSVIDNKFIPDGRELIKHRIADEPKRAVRKTESLSVDASGNISLSFVPVEGNQIEIEETVQDHVSGQIVNCTGYSEGDEVEVAYYHMIAGRNWFSEAAAFRQVDHSEYVGMNDYEYNSARLWAILLEMGLVTGEIV